MIHWSFEPPDWFSKEALYLDGLQKVWSRILFLGFWKKVKSNWICTTLWTQQQQLQLLPQQIRITWETPFWIHRRGYLVEPWGFGLETWIILLQWRWRKGFWWKRVLNFRIGRFLRKPKGRGRLGKWLEKTVRSVKIGELTQQGFMGRREASWGFGKEEG